MAAWKAPALAPACGRLRHTLPVPSPKSPSPPQGAPRSASFYGTEPSCCRSTPSGALRLSSDNSLNSAEGSLKKQNGRSAFANRPISVLNRGLQRVDVGSLQTLRATHNFEFNSLAVVQGLVAFRLDRGIMYEYIFPGLALDEAEALAGVKPLHGSLFFTHFVFLFSSLKLSGALLRSPCGELLPRLRSVDPLSGHKKRPQ